MLWRPTGPEELALVQASGWRRWPPRLPEQPIFYPVLNEEYATMIARDWNVKRSGVGYQRSFPLPPDPDGTLVDRGHLIPMTSSLLGYRHDCEPIDITAPGER